MVDLDFVGLRDEIESAIVQPDFEEVALRARRARNRGRLATAAAMLVVLAILGPAGMISALHRTGGLGAVADPDATTQVPIGPGPVVATTDTEPPSSAAVSLITAAGTDLEHAYALVDVCRATSCNLQLSPVLTGQGGNDPGPARIGLLRDHPGEGLSSVDLDALGDNTVQISAVPEGRPRQTQRIDVAVGSPGPVSSAQSAGWPVQLPDQAGVAIVSASGQADRTPSQPNLVNPRLVGGPGIDKGIWVTGVDKVTGALAVAVSHDRGGGWSVVDLGAPAGTDPPALATRDGHTAYLLARVSDGTLALFRSRDGGLSWQRLDTSLPWPQGSSTQSGYGLAVRPDGSLLAWLAGGAAPVYLQSVDGGTTFAGVAGPGGRIVSLSDGYLSLGSAVKVSRDALTWVDARIPYLKVS